MRHFVLGDIHGAYRALKQCFESSKFDYQNDKLIVLGDVCDGYPEVSRCIDELLKIKNLIYVRGNHDQFFIDYLNNGNKPDLWIEQGGNNTLNSYRGKNIPEEHKKFLERSLYWYIKDQVLFVHGGIIPGYKVEVHDKDSLLWDRDLIRIARLKGNNRPEYRLQDIYKAIFIGHTPTINYKSSIPIKACEIVNIDTGAGWGYKLTIMDLDTGEFWQSDDTSSLYLNSRGRKDKLLCS